MFMRKELGMILLRRLLNDFKCALNTLLHGCPRVFGCVLVKIRYELIGEVSTRDETYLDSVIVGVSLISVKKKNWD